MIVLVPVSMFTVPYQVARGRPYSRLERRVLEDIASREGTATREGATLTSLCETFHVHERLMVEAVVTLVGAGWVAVASGREAAFVLTDEGQKACSTGKDPASVTVESAAPCTLIFDRTTGQLARRGEVPTVSAGEAHIDLNPCTPERIHRNTLDESQIQKLLPRATGDWVRSIGRARLVTFRRYVAVRADLSEQTVVGLPRSWYQALSPEILAVARRRHEEDEEKDPLSPTLAPFAIPTEAAPTSIAMPAPPGPGYQPTPLNNTQPRSAPSAAALGISSTGPSSFAWLDEERPQWRGANSPDPSAGAALFSMPVGNESHGRLLAEALSTAYRHVLISSPIITIESLTALGDIISAAVSRGVRVDILYGKAGDSTNSKDVVKFLHQLGYHASAQRGRDLLRPAKKPTGSGASLLLFDRAGGPLEAVIGDHAWCGPSQTRVSSSVHLGGSEFMAQVARAAAGLWVWGSDPDSAERWRSVANKCQDDTALESIRGGGIENQVSAELIVDDEHAAIVHAKTDADTVYVGRSIPHEEGPSAGIRGITVALRASDVEAATARTRR